MPLFAYIELFEIEECAELHEMNFSPLPIFHFYLQTDDFKGVMKGTESFGREVGMDTMHYCLEDDNKQAKIGYLKDSFDRLF